MTKRNLSVLCACVLGFGASYTAPVQARPASTQVDGCAVLQEIVVTELTLSQWYGLGYSGPLLPDSGDSNEVICYQTALAVTGAFSAAFADMDIDITWNFWPDYRGDSCLSADLSQCYPDRYPLSGNSMISQAYVLDSWNAVRRTVSDSMPLGTASDTSRFSVSQFGSRLSRGLDPDVSSMNSYRQLKAIEGRFHSDY